jgi:hypothetical protein
MSVEQHHDSRTAKYRDLGYFLGRPPERGTCADLSLTSTFAHLCRANSEAWTFLPFFSFETFILFHSVWIPSASCSRVAYLGTDPRKRKRIEDDFTPQLEAFLVGLDGTGACAGGPARLHHEGCIQKWY